MLDRPLLRHEGRFLVVMFEMLFGFQLGREAGPRFWILFCLLCKKHNVAVCSIFT